MFISLFLNFYLFIKLLICFCIASWFHWIVSLYSFVPKWVSLKQLFWIFCWVSHRSLMVLFLVTGRLLWFFSGVMLPWFLYDPEVLVCCLCIWSNSHILQSSLTAFERKRTSISPLEILRLSQTFYRCSWLMLLSFCDRILKLVCFFLMLQCTRSSAESLSFIFPKWQ